MPYLARPKGLANQHPGGPGGSICYIPVIFRFFPATRTWPWALALMIGLNLPQNFDSPYKATGSRFLAALASYPEPLAARFPLYPLGGNRKGASGWYVNLFFLTMLIGGAWHGSRLNIYSIWGAMHGLMLSVNHFSGPLSRARHFKAGKFFATAPVVDRIHLFCLQFLLGDFPAPPDPESALAVYRPMFRSS